MLEGREQLARLEKQVGLVVLLGAMALPLAMGAFAPTSAAGAEPPRLLTKFCPPGEGAGQCSFSAVSTGGLAVDRNTGRIYVANSQNRRVDRFGPWGEFELAWGWGVRTGAPQLEQCGPQANSPSATCLRGVTTDRAGGFDQSLAAVAVDSQGAVYTYEGGNTLAGGNLRVQKFSAEGEFILEFGGEVNETDGTNICTAASDDDCGPGREGDASGFFAPGYVCPEAGSCLAETNIAQFLAIGPGDKIHVGDKERIQFFDTAGEWQGELPLPAGEVVKALAVDSGGNMLVAFQPKSKAAGAQFASRPNVQKLGPAGQSVCTAEVVHPGAIAVAGDGSFYVVSRLVADTFATTGITQFTPTCAKVDLGVPAPGFGGAAVPKAGGLATSEACGVPEPQLLATNVAAGQSYGAIFGSPADIELCPPPAEPPEIAEQFVVDADDSSARVAARINPRFWPDTRHYVEYGAGKCSEGGCDRVAPAPPGAIVTDSVVNEPVRTVPITLSGLEPGTTYHYRFVAAGTGGSSIGPERVLRTYARPAATKADCSNQHLRIGLSRYLPDCRAYEMVSPVNKNNGDIDPTGEQGLALGAVDGERVAFASFRAFAEPQGAPFSNQYLAQRGATGWLTRALSPPREQLSMYVGASRGASFPFKTFTPDLCSAWLVQDNRIPLAPGASPDVPNLYRRHNCPGSATDSFSLLTTAAPPGYGYEPGASVYYPDPQGFSADGSRTVFRAPAKLTANACDTKGILQVYEQIEGGALHLVSLRPNNQPVCTHSSAGTPQGLAGDFRNAVLQNAVSADGRRVFWTASDNSDPGLLETWVDFTGTIYLRANVGGTPVVGEGCLNSAQSCTIRVSERVSEKPARFWGADTQGTAAIFSIGTTLYWFTTSPSPTVSELADGLISVMGISQDARRVYFASTEVLSGAQQNSAGDVAQPGEPNLYLVGIGEDPVFIATLSKADIATATATREGAAELSPLAVLPFRRTSRVSADGLHAAFTSSAALTGADNVDQHSGEQAAEVFLYDAEAGEVGELICVSCSPSGARPTARRFSTKVIAARIPGWTEQLRPTRALADDGERVYFESYERLVLRDTNSHRDVYQWRRAESEAQCVKEQGGEVFVPESSGCLSLISSGSGQEDASFIDASANGSDVWFATNSSLVPQDPGLYDVYDAREGGGFPPPAGPARPCEGAACQTPAAPPVDPAVSSSVFSGPGNVKQPTRARGCPKGKRKVRQGGKARCVKVRKKATKKTRTPSSKRAGRATR